MNVIVVETINGARITTRAYQVIALEQDGEYYYCYFNFSTTAKFRITKQTFDMLETHLVERRPD